MAACEKCGREFPSRNKLFKHLKNPLGCEAAAAESPAPGGDEVAAAADATATDICMQLAQLVARLVAEQGGVLQAASAGELLSRYHGGLLRRYQRSLGTTGHGAQDDANGTWLSALVPKHPELLSLERVGGELQLRCDDALAVSAATKAAALSKPAVVDAKAAAAAAARLRSSICGKASNCKEASPEGWVPVPWLVRAVEKRLAAYVLLAPRADLARAADPGRFGVETATDEQLARGQFRRRRGGSSWATLTAHFREFALAEAASNSAMWEWRDDGRDWQERYTAEKQKSAKEAEAYAVGSCFKSHLRLGSNPSAGDGDRSTSRSAAADNSAGDIVGADSAERLLDHALVPNETLLLLIAGQAPRGRIGAAVVLELQLCARHHCVSSYLSPVSPGLWALKNCSGGDKHRRANFIAEMQRCAALRRPPLLLVSTTPAGGVSESAAAMRAVASLVQAKPESSHELQFSLETEGLYPENVPSRLPYHKPTAAVGFAVAIAAALGKSGFEHTAATGGGTRVQDRYKLVVIEALSPHTADPSGRLILACEAASSNTTRRDSLLCESVFWSTWSHRPHQFEGCLDLHLATVAVNVARYVVLARRRADNKGRDLPLNLLDPCCGSGTITAAALGAGGWGNILATELRPEWVEHAKANLRRLSSVAAVQTGSRLAVGGSNHEDAARQPPAKRARLQTQAEDDGLPLDKPSGACPAETSWTVRQHDATLDFACGMTTEGVDAVVANPPWGKRIGQGTNSSILIVRSLLRQFPTAVHVIFCPSLAGCLASTSGIANDGGEDGWEVLHEVKVGGKTSMFVLARTLTS